MFDKDDHLIFEAYQQPHLNKWGGWVVYDKNGNTATVSIWKVPGIWMKGPLENSKYFYDKRKGYRYDARLDVTGPNAAGIYLGIKDPTDPESRESGYRDARSREELYPVIKKRLEELGFSTEGIENCKTKLSMHAWGKDPAEYAAQPEYNPDDHIAQAKFNEKMREIVAQVNYRLKNPSEFDD